jgi:hypothetical protein
MRIDGREQTQAAFEIEPIQAGAQLVEDTLRPRGQAGDGLRLKLVAGGMGRLGTAFTGRAAWLDGDLFGTVHSRA